MTQGQIEPRSPIAATLVVIVCGLITTVASLWWFLLEADGSYVSLMYWYFRGMVPIGAVMVGVAAGFGYAGGSWLSGVRITRMLVLMILAVQLTAYVGAEYLRYRNFRSGLPSDAITESGEPLTFVRYYDLKARNMNFEQESGQKGEPLGMWGYPLLLITAVAFVLAGVFPPLLLAATPHCGTCQRYMSTRQLGMLPASVPERRLKSSDEAGRHAYDQEQARVAEVARETMLRMSTAINASDAQSMRREIAAAPVNRATKKLPQRVLVELVHCKSCMEGTVKLTLLQGRRKTLQTSVLQANKVPPQFVTDLLRRA
jgi:hypothetical protein